MRRRAQIDLRHVAFQNALVDDQMLQRIKLLLPAGLGQFNGYAVVQDQVPAPLRDAGIGSDARGDGAMGGNLVYQVRRRLRRAGADQLGQTPEFFQVTQIGASPCASGRACHKAKGRFSTRLTKMASG
jgi:hypothetical protein